MATQASAAAGAAPSWVRRYLALLGVPRSPPSPTALAALTRAHLLAVPFENVSQIYRRHAHPEGPVPSLEYERRLSEWEQRRAGGLCFDVAAMFARLLGALGYRAHPILAIIRFPGSHQAVVVELDGRRYLVDVGSGAPLFEPIPLDRTVEVRRIGLAYRFRPDEGGDGCWQDLWIERGWAPFCYYDLRPVDPREWEAVYQRLHGPDQAWLTHTLLIRCQDDQAWVLRDDELRHVTAAGARVERVTDPAAYAHLAAEVFHLPALPIAAARAALAARARAAPPGSALEPAASRG